MFLDVGISLLPRWICVTTQPPKVLAHTVLLVQNSLLGFAQLLGFTAPSSVTLLPGCYIIVLALHAFCIFLMF
jgi:hypothetical protein